MAALTSAAIVVAGTAAILLLLPRTQRPGVVEISQPVAVRHDTTTNARPHVVSAPPASVSWLAVDSLPPAVPGAVEIPAIGVYNGLIGPGGDWRAQGPAPGQRGEAVLVDQRHSGSREIPVGERVTVHRADGISAVFTVARVERQQLPPGEATRPELRLITGEFVIHCRFAGAYRR
ncbi:class F sortase [Amycolatopsis suaedae]|uniref:Class F sortase n=1 Tax=Amycolatopsis suaedae TaxID=2510978 RepID=A0A4Q7J7R3_9PSEU|nr:class F sortase [Amycolatopsis suaedae]RZQ62094.1 class F sortase [Amycolatopsis suaedae]